MNILKKPADYAAQLVELNGDPSEARLVFWTALREGNGTLARMPIEWLQSVDHDLCAAINNLNPYAQ